jgi:hypothetical protein
MWEPEVFLDFGWILELIGVTVGVVKFLGCEWNLIGCCFGVDRDLIGFGYWNQILEKLAHSVNFL